MQRLNPDYIARTQEIGKDNFPALVKNREMAGETQDFYQGLLAGLDEFLKMDRELSATELVPTLELLEAKLATKIDTYSVTDSFGKPTVDYSSALPCIGRLDPSYVDQLGVKGGEAGLGQVVDNIVRDGETQDFYQGAIAAIDFAKSIATDDYAFAAIGFMKINIATHIDLEREPVRLTLGGDDLMQDYADAVAPYVVDPVPAGLVNYQSPLGVGVILSLDNWDKASTAVDAVVYSYIGGMTKGEPAVYEDLDEACSDFASRLQQLEGSMDDAKFFMSPSQKKKLRSHLVAASEELLTAENEQEVIRQNLEQNLEQSERASEQGNSFVENLMRLHFSMSPQPSPDPDQIDEDDEEFLRATYSSHSQPVGEPEELTPEANEFIWDMEDLLLDAVSKPGAEGEFEIVKDWTVYLEDGGYVRVVANTDNHLVLRASPEGEIVSGLSYTDAVKLSAELDEQDSRLDDDDIDLEAVDWDALALVDELVDEEELVGVSAQHLEIIDAFQMAIATQILPIVEALQDACGLFSVADEQTEIRYSVSDDYELVKEDAGMVTSLVATDGRGELLRIQDDRVLAANNLTQADADIWQAIGEHLESLDSDYQAEEALYENPDRTQKKDKGFEL